MSTAAPSIATRSRWPWVLVAVYLLILPVTLWLTGVNGRSWLEVPRQRVIAFTAFGVLGAMILSEQRDNVIGLLLISSPLVLSVGAICGEIATWLIRTDGSSSLAIIGSVVNTAAYVFGVIGVLLLITIWFPDGRPPSRRWRWYPWAVVIFLVLSTIILVVATPELSGSGPETIPNTLYVSQADRLGGEDVIGTCVLRPLRARRRLALRALPSLRGNRTAAGQVDGERRPVRAGGSVHRGCLPRRDAQPDRERDRVLRDPRRGRRGGPSLPPLRPRRRHQESRALRHVGVVRDS